MLLHNLRTSRRQHELLRMRIATLLFVLFSSFAPVAESALMLSHADAVRIGKQIWQNECNGTVAGLTSWNEGENFASLGIGHFIWYPKGVRGPFEESFPKLVSFISARGAKLPTLLLVPNDLTCPWRTRAEFLAAQNASEMTQLRRFLADTVDLQAEFMVARLEHALPKMLAEAPAARRNEVERNFNRVASTPGGCYALVDYVNFKGEGVLHSERYRGEGWGLLQVLAGMQNAHNSAVNSFAHSAEAILRRRVQNSPPERKESRWLPGWLNRITTYTKE